MISSTYSRRQQRSTVSAVPSRFPTALPAWTQPPAPSVYPLPTTYLLSGSASYVPSPSLVVLIAVSMCSWGPTPAWLVRTEPLSTHHSCAKVVRLPSATASSASTSSLATSVSAVHSYIQLPLTTASSARMFFPTARSAPPLSALSAWAASSTS